MCIRDSPCTDDEHRKRRMPCIIIRSGCAGIHDLSLIHISTALRAAVEKAEALKEADYTADCWKAMQLELQEAKDLLAKEKPTQAEVDEATTHLNAAVAVSYTHLDVYKRQGFCSGVILMRKKQH